MPPPLSPLLLLQRQAAGDCAAHASRVLGHPVNVSVDASLAAWNPVGLRHVLEQRMTLARPVADLEVLLDTAGRVLGFIDHGAAAPSPEGEPDDAALATLLLSTGILTAPLMLGERRRDPEGALVVLLATAAAHAVARIDTGRNAVISIEPVTPP